MFSQYSSPYLENKFLVPEGYHGLWSFSNIFEKRGVNEGVFQLRTSPLDAAKYSKYYTLTQTSVRQITYIQAYQDWNGWSLKTKSTSSCNKKSGREKWHPRRCLFFSTKHTLSISMGVNNRVNELMVPRCLLSTVTVIFYRHLWRTLTRITA